MSRQLQFWRKVVASTVAYTLAFGQIAPAAYAAATDISDVPLSVKNQVPPNIMMTLDDSGSMQWEFLPEEEMEYSMYMFPRPNSPYGAGEYFNQTPNFAANNSHNFFGRSSHNNKAFYNPDITYTPWANADGSPFPQATPTAALYNPKIPGLGTMNLTVLNTQNSLWFTDSGSGNPKAADCEPVASCNPPFFSAPYAFWPITYFKYKGPLPGTMTERRTAANYTKVEIKPSDTGPYSYNGVDASGNPVVLTRTKAEEIQNFANWFQYYRSRILLARAGIGKAFSLLSTASRVGFGTINTGSQSIDGQKSNGTIVKGVRPFAGTDRTTFFDTLYNQPIDTKNTPLRQAMDDVGQYFKRTGNGSPWALNPGTGGIHLTCRQNFNIFLTDGYWNEGKADTSDAQKNNDGIDGPLHNGFIDGAEVKNRGYKPTRPYMDKYDNTLADVAMYYWVTDLRPDLNNNVPVVALPGLTSTENAAQNTDAFWQHMSVYGVALGVFGTINGQAIKDALANPPTGELVTAVAPATQPTDWPDPGVDTTKARIDDLAHAGVNTRGGFFSTSNPNDLSESLSAALSSISSKTSAVASVGVTSAILQAGDNRLFASEFTPGFTWSGQLYSIPINLATGVPDAVPTWTAQGQLDAMTSDTGDKRKIVTYDPAAAKGIRFQRTSASGTGVKLNATQQAVFNTPAVAPADGGDVIDYLRGHRGKENAGVYRTRAHLLGDLVNAQPVVVVPPGAGYIENIDPGYPAFRAAAAQKNRRKVVLQGANDGMLHAFDAGDSTGDAGTGAELWAYVPNLLWTSMNNLSRKTGYVKKPYVDATPVVGDIDANRTPNVTPGAPAWKTIAVGGLGKGGRGYYALDVTSTEAADEDTLTKKVLWEFPNAGTPAADKVNVGYTYGKALITKLATDGSANPIPRWVVIVPSGYNNGTDTGGNGQGWLYVIDALTGKLVRSITTGVGTAASPSGLAHISGYVENGDLDNRATYVYGGDVLGNVWRFDLTSSNPASWSVTKLATLMDAGGAIQPVTTEPELARITDNGIYRYMVYVGTGRLLGDTDMPGAAPPIIPNASASQVQTMYGLVDNRTAAPLIPTNLRTSLVKQTLTEIPKSNGSRTATNNALNFATARGWYIDLPEPGERVNTHPVLAVGALVFTTNVPSSDPCTLGGFSFLNVLDFKNGGKYTDVGAASVSSVKFSQALASGVVLVKKGVDILGAVRLSTPGIGLSPVKTGASGSVAKRRSWRELSQ